MKRIALLVTLLSGLCWGGPILTDQYGLPLTPAYTPQGLWSTRDLGNGLIWEGPALTDEEWQTRLGSVPGDPLAVNLMSAQTYTPDTHVPEPSTLLLVGVGLTVAIFLAHRRVRG